jgi:DNA-binding transcriptional LysR family regulator
MVAFDSSTRPGMTGALNWDEFRLVKAIADSRSLVGAATKLGLNHSTVFRRLTALEGAIGVRLFERSRYQPTAAGEAMINVAADIGESVVEFERHVAGRDIKPSGLLRVTTIDALAIYILPPILNRFRESYPGVELDLILSAEDLSLSRRDAEVALRATSGPTGALVGEKICTLRWAIYCAPELALRYGDDVIGSAPGSVRATITGRCAAGAGSRLTSRESGRCVASTPCSRWRNSPSSASEPRCCPALLAMPAPVWCGLARCRASLTSISGC